MHRGGLFFPPRSLTLWPFAAEEKKTAAAPSFSSLLDALGLHRVCFWTYREREREREMKIVCMYSTVVVVAVKQRGFPLQRSAFVCVCVFVFESQLFFQVGSPRISCPVSDRLDTLRLNTRKMERKKEKKAVTAFQAFHHTFASKVFPFFSTAPQKKQKSQETSLIIFPTPNATQCFGS